MSDVDDRPSGVPPPLLPGVMRLTVNYECGTLTAANVFHFLLHETGGLGATDVSNMAKALGEYWINDVWTHRASDTATTTDIEATYALIEGEPNVKRVKIADAILGINGGVEAGQVALLYLWDTGDARRGGKPRTYLPFPSEDQISPPAAVTGAVITAANSSIVTFLGHIAGHTVGQLVCDNFIEYSTVNHKAYRTAGQAFTIASGTISPFVATQRRRVDRLRS
jgi:hypothetical protein